MMVYEYYYLSDEFVVIKQLKSGCIGIKKQIS